MSDIPELAIERYKRLRERADGARAAMRDASEELHHVQGELTRVEAGLQRHSRGRPLGVDDDGSVFFVQEYRRQVQDPRSNVGHYIELEDRKIPFTTPEALAVGREVAALRVKVREVRARRDRLTEEASTFVQIANACERELTARGWQDRPSMFGRVTGTGGGGLTVLGGDRL